MSLFEMELMGNPTARQIADAIRRASFDHFWRPTPGWELDLTARQHGIGERLDRFVQRPEVRSRLRREVELWTTSELPRDSGGIPLRPFPVDKKREPNSRREKLVLLAAAFQAFFPAGEPILPAVFDIDERPERLLWCGLIRTVGQLPDDELSYLDQYLEEFAADVGPLKQPREHRKCDQRFGTCGLLDQLITQLTKEAVAALKHAPAPTLKPVTMTDLGIHLKIKGKPHKVYRAFRDKRYGPGLRRSLEILNHVRANGYPPSN